MKYIKTKIVDIAISAVGVTIMLPLPIMISAYASALIIAIVILKKAFILVFFTIFWK